MRPTTTTLLSATLWLTTLAAPAIAQTVPEGRLLASNCFQCHGTDGRGPGFDRLAGKSASDLYHELLEMRAGKEGPGLMTKHAMGYTDAQLRALSQYLSTVGR
jgi:cytochrome c553